jgi:hypothetical protein
MSFDRDRILDQFEQILYDWYAGLDPADFEDDMDRIERAKEAGRLVDLLDAYNEGSITADQFLDEFNTGDTFEEIPGFDEWFNEVRSTVSEDAGGSENDCVVITQENAEECGYEITSDGQLVPIDLGDDPNSYPDYFNCGGGIFAKTEADCPEMEVTGDPCDDPENASLPECAEKSFEDYVKEVGEGVANTAKGLYDELEGKFTECVGSPIDCIKKIGKAILDAGIPPECQNMGDPWFCTEKGPDEGGKACWKDCLDFNTPGLPLPNIPLPPGVVDIGTYRDFENAIKTVGHTIGDIIDGKEACGDGGKQECTVGQVLEDLGTWAKEKWEEAISGIDDATADDVLDWLKGVLGSVTAGIIWAEIEEEVTNILTSYDTSDDGKCIERGYFENNQEKCEALGYVDCDTLTEGETQLTGGIQKGEENCSEVVDPNGDENGCTDGTWNENMQQCMCSDGVTPEDADGKCEDDSTTTTPEELCQEKNLTYNPDDPTADEDGCVDDSTTTTPEECTGENEVRRGGLEDGDCIEIGQSCFSEPGSTAEMTELYPKVRLTLKVFVLAAGMTELLLLRVKTSFLLITVKTKTVAQTA